MKTIGVLGGMSWESTAQYYRYINAMVKERLGGRHSAEMVLVSVDFAIVEALQAAGDWEAAGRLLADKAAQAQAANAEFLILATNTMHKVAPAIETAITIPLLHIADATAALILAKDEIANAQANGGGEARRENSPCVGLLGTRFTMEQEFYAGRLRDMHGIEVLTPPANDREIVHRIIYQELVLGRVLESSRAEYIRITQALAARGAQGVILGCTEIGMLLRPTDVALPLYDTTSIHAAAAVEEALK
jgi:aspartate racemase